MLDECWSRGFVFADYVMFKERPFEGQYVNVSDVGYRFSKDQGPWPPNSTNFNIFVFGGSTTFGYGVADDETIASRLQEAWPRQTGKRICVYNFSCAFYYSTQERILFEKLLSNGLEPQVALFIDGLNDVEIADDRPMQMDQLAAVFNHPRQLAFLGPGADRIPMLRMVRSFAYDIARARAKKSQDSAPSQAGAAFARYRRNKALIEAACRIHCVTPLFVWQPVPGYEYDLNLHLFAERERCRSQQQFYAEVKRSIEAIPPGTNFLWCADLQHDARECLYVDSVHYAPGFSKTFAEAIVARSRQQQ
jgi:hypothetical protein